MNGRNGRNRDQIIMRQNWNFLRQHLPWLALLAGIDIFAAVLLWLANAAAFRALAAVIVLATVFLFAAVCGILGWQSRRRQQAFWDFLDDPDVRREEALVKLAGAAQTEGIRRLGRLLRENRYKYEQTQARVEEYEEYVEAWAHETKTPIALLTLLLDHHREEIPEAVGFRLDYVRSRMQELTEQILFCARLKSTQKDYLFEYVSVRACVEEVIGDYRPLLEEKQFQVILCVPDREIYTDRRSLRFMLSQTVSNAVKYSGAEPELVIKLERSGAGAPADSAEAKMPEIRNGQSAVGESEFSAGLPRNAEKDVLLIRDNGRGVKSCDLPYIFNRGFTGASGEEEKNATGMGLYLVRELAGELGVTLAASSVPGEGFEMRMEFPVVSGEK